MTGVHCQRERVQAHHSASWAADGPAGITAPDPSVGVEESSQELFHLRDLHLEQDCGTPHVVSSIQTHRPAERSHTHTSTSIGLPFTMR
jgi:hypothetical protein